MEQVVRTGFLSGRSSTARKAIAAASVALRGLGVVGDRRARSATGWGSGRTEGLRGVALSGTRSGPTAHADDRGWVERHPGWDEARPAASDLGG